MTDSLLQTDDMSAASRLLDAGFAERSVSVGDAMVSYRQCGSGPVIVLLHGIGSGAASWLHCGMELGREAQVVAWNAPGYGNSTGLPMAQPSAADYAVRLEQFLAALGIQECLLVGHSLGAMMAAAYVAAGRRRVAQLLLLSPAQGYGSDALRERGATIASERLQALATLGPQGMAQNSSGRMLSPQAGEAARAMVRWNMARLNPDGYTQAVHMLCGDDIHRYVPAAVPAAVYCGAADVVTTPQASSTLAEAFHLPFGLIDAAGHACYVEQPAAAAAVIRQHLKQLFQD